MAINYSELYDLIYDTSGEEVVVRPEWLAIYDQEDVYKTKDDAIKHGVVFTEDEDFVYRVIPYQSAGGSASLPVRVTAEYTDDGYVVKNQGVLTRNTVSQWMSYALKCYNIEVKDTVTTADYAKMCADAYEAVTGNSIHALSDEDILRYPIEDKASFAIVRDSAASVASDLVKTAMLKVAADTYYNYLIDNYDFDAGDYKEEVYENTDNFIYDPKDAIDDPFGTAAKLFVDNRNFTFRDRSYVFRTQYAAEFVNGASAISTRYKTEIETFVAQHPSYFIYAELNAPTWNTNVVEVHYFLVSPDYNRGNIKVETLTRADGSKYNSFTLTKNALNYLNINYSIQANLTKNYTTGQSVLNIKNPLTSYYMPTTDTTIQSSYPVADYFNSMGLGGNDLPFNKLSGAIPTSARTFQQYIDDSSDPWDEVGDDEDSLPITLAPDDYPPRKGTPIVRTLERPPVEQDDPPEPDEEDDDGTEVEEDDRLEYDGFVNIYNPSDTVLTAFQNELWDDGAIETLKKWWSNNPMDGIISLHRIFIQPEHKDATNRKIVLGKFKASSQCLVCKRNRYLNLGSIEIPRKYNDVRDFESKVILYLPFVGFKELDTTDVMGGSINIKYSCDIATGDFLVTVGVNRTGNTDNKVLYTFDGNCAISQPVSSSDRTGVIRGVASTVTGLAKSIAKKDVMGAVGSVAGGAMDIMNNIAPNISRSGNMSGCAGAYGYKIPYVIVERPYTYDAKNYQDLYGYPSNTTVTLKNLIGYNRLREVHVDTIPNASDMEKQEIENILKSGVIF